MFFEIQKFTRSKIELYTIIKLNSHKNIERTIESYRIEPLNENKKPNNKQ